MQMMTAGYLKCIAQAGQVRAKSMTQQCFFSENHH